MEFIRIKRGKKRKRKRYVNSKQTYDQIKFKVRSEKEKFITECNFFLKKKKLISNIMNASAFWENYKAAYEWQKTHNITWWKTKCFALEHENHILKETIRNLIQKQNYRINLTKILQNKQVNYKKSSEFDNIEFYLNEGMMDFLTQSIQHKIELKNKKNIKAINEKNIEQIVEGGQKWIKKRNKDAKLLYGKLSSKIMAMETALQTTIERHVAKKKPQYWPNIPLRL